jgi:hypothetical protein
MTTLLKERQHPRKWNSHWIEIETKYRNDVFDIDIAFFIYCTSIKHLKNEKSRESAIAYLGRAKDWFYPSSFRSSSQNLSAFVIRIFDLSLHLLVALAAVQGS